LFSFLVACIRLVVFPDVIDVVVADVLKLDLEVIKRDRYQLFDVFANLWLCLYSSHYLFYASGVKFENA
jgi:hypothetical protein